MHPFQLVTTCCARFHSREHVGHISMRGAIQHRLKPLGTLRMTLTGQVVQIGGVGGEQHRHGAVTLTVAGRRVAKRDYRALTMVFPVEHPSPRRPVLELVGTQGVAARVRPWIADPQVAVITLTDPSSVALAVQVPAWLNQIAQAGYQRVRTSALAPAAATAFQRHGLTVVQDLAVLSLGPVALAQHDRRSTSPDWRVRALHWGLDALRPRRDIVEALEVDRLAFGEGLRLDIEMWRDAIRATPQRRVALIRQDPWGVVAFAITGVGGDTGFLQRLAVHPELQRRGLARALVSDAIGWVSPLSVRHLFVNTARDNEEALGLYQSMGFQLRTEGLLVLGGALAATPESTT